MRLLNDGVLELTIPRLLGLWPHAALKEIDAQAGGGLVVVRPASPLPGSPSRRAWKDACQPGLRAAMRSVRRSC
jgi:hypothetical protein